MNKVITFLLAAFLSINPSSAHRRKSILSRELPTSEFQLFRNGIHNGINNLKLIKDNGSKVRFQQDGLLFRAPLAADKRQMLFQAAADVLKNISETIKEKNRAALQDISRKAIRRINERAIAAYYVDRIDRDYFTEYFSEINDEAGSADENFFEENLNSSLLTNVEKEGLFSAYAYTSASEVLEAMAEDENSMDFDYCDGQNGSQCELAAMLRVGNASRFNEAEFNVNGAKFKLSDKLAEKASKLQVFVTSALRNPYTFDPSIKFTGPIISIGLKDPEIGLYVSENETVEISIPLDFSKFDDPKGAHIFQVVAKPLLDVKIDDIPALKMTLLPNTTFTIRVFTQLAMDLYLVIMEKFRTVPLDLCRPEVKKLKPIVGSCSQTCMYPPVNFTSQAGPEAELRDYYIGISPNLNEGASPNISINQNVSIGLSVYRLNCVFRDDDRHVWSENGCQVKETTATHVICSCPHLSTFTATQLVTPTFLELADARTLALNLRNNYVIGLAVGLLILIYLLLVLICHRLDVNDDKAPGIHLMVDPSQGVHVYYYLVTVYSGGLFKPLWIQPTCNVSLQLYGCNGASLPYVIREESQSQEFRLLRNNGVDSFLVSSYKDLGKIQKIRIWRDNNGRHPEWYCRKIIVHCLNSRKIYHFFVNRALSVGYFGYATTHEVLAATPAEISSWRRRYAENVYDLFSERHTWLSAFQRRPGTLFTRCQRLTCAFSTVFVKLILTFAFLNVFHDHRAIEVGEFAIQSQQIVIALEIFLLMLPAEHLVRFLFKVSKPGIIPTLVVWPSSKKLGFNNYQIFGLPPEDSETHPELIPVYIPHQFHMTETEDKFSIPQTDTPEMEQWLSGGIQANQVISYDTSQPDYFIRAFEDGSGDATENSALTYIERAERIEQIRQSRPTTFTFSQEGHEMPLEGLIDDEIQRNQWLGHGSNKAKGKKRFNNEPNESERLAKLMNQLGLSQLPPVQVVQVRSQGNQGNFTYVSVGLHAPVGSKICRLPRCCIALGWIVGLILILGSAVIAVFYGLQIGPIGTRRIFANMIITILLSIFVTQPLVILILAGIKTTIFKTKSLISEERFQVINADKKPEPATLKPYRFDTFLPQRFYPPLSQVDSFRLKIQSIRAHNTSRNLLKLLLHTILMLLFVLVTYSNFSKHEYLAVRNMKEVLRVDTEWAEIKNASEFYRYFERLFEENVFPRQYYDGDPIVYFEEAPVFMSDEASLLMGVPRLHQFRIHPDSTCTKSKTPYCATEAFIQFDTADYGPKWLPLSRVGSSIFPKNNVWKYEANLDAFGQLGFIRDYPRGGYIAYLGRNFFRSFAVLNYLERTDWIDGRTRAIFFEISVYNANVNLFLYTKLMAEISGAGSWFTSSITLPITLTNAKSYAQEVDNTVLNLALLFGLTMVLLGVKIIVIIYEWRAYSSLYKSDILLVTLTFISVVVAWYRLNLIVELKERIDHQLVNDHVPLDRIAFWDSLQQDLFAITFCYAVLMIWEFLLAAKKEFYMLNLCLYLTRTLLLGQAVILVLLLVSFSVTGHLLFGGASVGFRSVWATFISLLHEIVDEYILDEIEEIYPTTGELFHLVFTFTAVIVGINLMIALLSQGFEDAKRIASHRTYWISYLNFIGKYFQLNSPTHQRPLPFVHPYRLRGMRQKTRNFLRACLQTPQVRRMQEMNQLCKRILAGTEYALVSNSLRKRRIRINIKYEERLEVMRRLALRMLNQKLNTRLTPGEVKEYSKFSKTILNVKLKKLEDRVRKLDDAVSKVEGVAVIKSERYEF